MHLSILPSGSVVQCDRLNVRSQAVRFVEFARADEGRVDMDFSASHRLKGSTLRHRELARPQIESQNTPNIEPYHPPNPPEPKIRSLTFAAHVGAVEKGGVENSSKPCASPTKPNKAPRKIRTKPSKAVQNLTAPCSQTGGWCPAVHAGSALPRRGRWALKSKHPIGFLFRNLV